jgi:hypothetical protein
MLGQECSTVGGLGAVFQEAGLAYHEARNALRGQLLSERYDVVRLARQWKWDGWVVSVIGRALQLAKDKVDLYEIGSGGLDLAHNLIQRWNRITVS